MANDEIRNVSGLKHALGISDMSDVTEEQVKEFIHMIPRVDKDVAIAFIKEMPASIKASAEITEQLRMLASDGIKSSDESTKGAIKAYQSVIDSISEAEKDPNLSLEDREKLWDRMESVAEKVDKKDSENKAFVSQTIKTVGTTILGGLLIVGAFLFGSKYFGDDD